MARYPRTSWSIDREARPWAYRWVRTDDLRREFCSRSAAPSENFDRDLAGFPDGRQSWSLATTRPKTTRLRLGTAGFQDVYFTGYVDFHNASSIRGAVQTGMV